MPWYWNTITVDHRMKFCKTEAIWQGWGRGEITPRFFGYQASQMSHWGHAKTILGTGHVARKKKREKSRGEEEERGTDHRWMDSAWPSANFDNAGLSGKLAERLRENHHHFSRDLPRLGQPKNNSYFLPFSLSLPHSLSAETVLALTPTRIQF